MKSPILQTILDDLNNGRHPSEEQATVADALILLGLVVFGGVLLFAGPIMVWATGAA